MPVTAAQNAAIEEVIRALTSATSRRVKRRLADMFMDLVDRDSWPEYYENKYKDPLQAYEDLNLVFLNALYYNEPGSQISKDATTLKGILENEWKQRSVLPAPPASAPSSSAQKTHAKKDQPERAAASPAPSKHQPAAQAPKASTKATAPSPMNVDPTPPSSSQPTEATIAKSPERPATPDVDVDIGGTPEPEVVGQDSARDGESDEIVRQLEKSLPRWEGFADVGWAEDIDPERMVDIVVTISKYRDESGNRLAVSLESIPEETNIPDLSFNVLLFLAICRFRDMLIVHVPTTRELTSDQSRTRMKYYGSSQAFDKEMSQLFLKARRWYELGSEPYGNVLVLQRFYHALTSANPPQPPYTSPTRFAALPAGPGTAKPLHASEGDAGVTTFRVSLKDRQVVEEVQYKGWSVKVADWLHLSNPDDPSRPIIGQVFKSFKWEEGQRKGQPGVSVCWYYRPEQTFHPASRKFWEKEVFKTSHFADHPVEDIVEKVAVQFTARHLRGRPRPPFWYPGWPLYVCDSRYNDRDRVFVKIKNWNSCIPEEVRKKEEFMPIFPFERPVFPRSHSSPFLSAHKIKAPGGIIDAPDKPESEKQENPTTTRKRPQRKAAQKVEAERAGASRTTASSQPAPVPATNTAHGYTAQGFAPYVQTVPPQDDRSIYAAAGGAAALNNAAVEELPAETARHFDRDPQTNEVLWFAAPPVDIVHTPPPRHSLKYLAFLARKRKQTREGGVAPGADMGVEPPPKRQKVPPTVMERLEALMKEHGMDQVPIS
ncbi:hypothetical protein BN946_scf184829.g61 [Trametes cinnabarina]|uniref:BAH domain-containing protein n=1 Tax=Pycnoporus cinnabarinus TaxID=5643 RepID=A0A060S8X2_PYCCI|nr:hypothetical protein BN946_scf184829.g61 [Trametes cinnabarina]